MRALNANLDLTTSRRLIWYKKNSDEIEGEIDMGVVPIEDLIEVFGSSTEDPCFFYVYDLNESCLSLIEKQVIEAKGKRDAASGTAEEAFLSGYLTAFHRVVSLYDFSNLGG